MHIYIKIKHLTQYWYFKSVKVTLLIMCINFLLSNGAKAQTYSNKPSFDRFFYGGMVVLSATDYYLTQKLDVQPHKWEISPIDKLAVYSLNTKAALSADITAGATLAGSAALALMIPKADQLGYMNQLVQNVWMTGNTVQLVKILVQRSRPYANGAGYVNNGNKDDHYSFFSGHSAITAAAASTALIYAFRNNQSASVKYVSLGTGLLALTTATLRIVAGKHYPSDVLTGILFGTGISLINAQIHKP